MKNIIINNHGVSTPNNPNPAKKTKLEIQIAALKSQEQQISKLLTYWEAKQKKANNCLKAIAEADKFGSNLLSEAVKEAEIKADSSLKYALKEQVEFALNFELGRNAFVKFIAQEADNWVSNLQNQLWDCQNQIQHEERKFARLEARRQGKTLLDCEYNKSIGCFGGYQCANCQSNYSVVSSPQLATNQQWEGAK